MSDVLDATTKPLKLSKNERVMMYHKISLENRLAPHIYFSYMLDLLIFKYLANRYIFKIDIVMYLMSKVSFGIRKFDLRCLHLSFLREKSCKYTCDDYQGMRDKS